MGVLDEYYCILKFLVASNKSLPEHITIESNKSSPPNTLQTLSYKYSANSQFSLEIIYLLSHIFFVTKHWHFSLKIF